MSLLGKNAPHRRRAYELALRALPARARVHIAIIHPFPSDMVLAAILAGIPRDRLTVVERERGDWEASRWRHHGIRCVLGDARSPQTWRGVKGQGLDSPSTVVFDVAGSLGGEDELPETAHSVGQAIQAAWRTRRGPEWFIPRRIHCSCVRVHRLPPMNPPLTTEALRVAVGLRLDASLWAQRVILWTHELGYRVEEELVSEVPGESGAIVGTFDADLGFGICLKGAHGQAEHKLDECWPAIISGRGGRWLRRTRSADPRADQGADQGADQAAGGTLSYSVREV